MPDLWETRTNMVLLRRREHLDGGGEKRREKQHQSGKLTAMERICLLLDPNSFVEIDGLWATDPGASSLGNTHIYPGDGVFIGWGTIEGRKVCVAAEDFTVVGGTLGTSHARKIARLQRMALDMRVPVIFLNDSGGARIEEGINALSGYGEIFQNHVRASGVIPQISAVLGPCSGGACYSPALCDFIFMVKDISHMFITGPGVVESVLGTRPTLEELGGAMMHSEKSGCVHALYNDEAACLKGIRTLLSYLPSSSDQVPSGHDFSLPEDLLNPETVKKAGERLRSLVPEQSRQTYDMHQVIAHLTDPGEPLFELQKHFAPNVITGFSRINGRVTGLIANQPMQLGGALDCDASDKMARFIRFCDCFGIPLLTLVDVPAFLPGTRQEQMGIIRHGAKILYAYSEAQVPKITLILRKAYGGAYIAMNSKNMGADLVYAWPIAEIAVMGAEGAVPILHRRELAESEDPKAFLEQKKLEYDELFANPDIAQSRGYIDEVILPEETRERLCRAFDFLSDKYAVKRAGTKRHGNIPL